MAGTSKRAPLATGAGARSRRRGWAPAAVTLVVLGLAGAARAGERAQPLRCLPTTLVSWQAAPPSPASRFGAANLPGIVLGPPGDSTPTTGSLTVASLGPGGSAILGFTDTLIEDRPGPDFIIFENGFFVGAPPTTTAGFAVFVEPATVEVSADGVQWAVFPFDAAAVADSAGGVADWNLFLRLTGLAGVTPTFSGNWTVPNAPDIWDPNRPGGVSGAGGDAFDLATVGISAARFIRLTDAAVSSTTAGSSAGFDLDAVVVLHGRPLPPASGDADGDRLGDGAEALLYASMPDVADSDGDGIDDGREVAGCRDPAGLSPAVAWSAEPRLTVRQTSTCTALNWTFLGNGALVDVVRGQVAHLAPSPPEITLGSTECLADEQPGVGGVCDAVVPPAGSTFFYLVRRPGGVDYGHDSTLAARTTPDGCP
ncbi:MAG: hypothetical protein ACE5IK_10120 [Acidobacteriota bacterium]